MRYFDNNEHWDNFHRVARSQIGCSFLHMSMVEGRSFDCSTFVGWCYLKSGLLTQVKYGFYPTKWFQDNPSYLLDNIRYHFENYLKSGVKVVEIFTEETLFRGDLIVLATWKAGVPNHAAIYLGDNQIIHCRPGKGVEVQPFEQCWFQKRLENIFRLENI